MVVKALMDKARLPEPKVLKSNGRTELAAMGTVESIPAPFPVLAAGPKKAELLDTFHE